MKFLDFVLGSLRPIPALKPNLDMIQSSLMNFKISPFPFIVQHVDVAT